MLAYNPGISDSLYSVYALISISAPSFFSAVICAFLSNCGFKINRKYTNIPAAGLQPGLLSYGAHKMAMFRLRSAAGVRPKRSLKVVEK